MVFRILVASVFLCSISFTGFAGSKIKFEGLIKKGLSEKKKLDKSLEELIDNAAYNSEAKEVLNFVQEELNHQNEQQVVDSVDSQSPAGSLVY